MDVQNTAPSQAIDRIRSENFDIRINYVFFLHITEHFVWKRYIPKWKSGYMYMFFVYGDSKQA